MNEDDTGLVNLADDGSWPLDNLLATLSAAFAVAVIQPREANPMDLGHSS